GNAAQLIAMNGPRHRGDSWWMNRAMTSLPVPDSPCRHVVASVAATCVARLMTSRQVSDMPTGSSVWRPLSLEEIGRRVVAGPEIIAGAHGVSCRRSGRSVAACEAFIANLIRQSDLLAHSESGAQMRQRQIGLSCDGQFESATTTR